MTKKWQNSLYTSDSKYAADLVQLISDFATDLPCGDTRITDAVVAYVESISDPHNTDHPAALTPKAERAILRDFHDFVTAPMIAHGWAPYYFETIVASGADFAGLRIEFVRRLMTGWSWITATYSQDMLTSILQNYWKINSVGDKFSEEIPLRQAFTRLFGVELTEFYARLDSEKLNKVLEPIDSQTYIEKGSR